jgi:transcriptional regulator with XRE-family HTH domain
VRNKLLYQAIGRLVRAQRESKGISQATLAEAVELTRTSITNLEAGNQQIPVHVLIKLAGALDVSVDDLVPNAGSLDHAIPRLPEDLPPRAAAFLNRVAAQAG